MPKKNKQQIKLDMIFEYYCKKNIMKKKAKSFDDMKV